MVCEPDLITSGEAKNHDKQTSSQRKCREHLSNQPSHRDNVTHQGIFISQPCYEDEWMECTTTTDIL